MNSKIGKWGNSPALRIPKPLLGLAGFSSTQQVNIIVSNGTLVIEPINKIEFELSDLVAQISNENSHSELDFGSTAGKELL